MANTDIIIQSLTGDKQTTLVPEALRVSHDDITMRPVMDYRGNRAEIKPFRDGVRGRTPTNLRTIHGAAFSSSAAGTEAGSTGPSADTEASLALMAVTH